jgi:hypothetical protein
METESSHPSLLARWTTLFRLLTTCIRYSTSTKVIRATLISPFLQASLLPPNVPPPQMSALLTSTRGPPVGHLRVVIPRAHPVPRLDNHIESSCAATILPETLQYSFGPSHESPHAETGFMRAWTLAARHFWCRLRRRLCARHMKRRYLTITVCKPVPDRSNARYLASTIISLSLLQPNRGGRDSSLVLIGCAPQ